MSLLILGNQNPMTISRVYSIKFICEFDMSKYPFDTQTCQIQMEMRGNSGSFAALISKELKYLGPIDLTQYFVKQWGMKMTTNETLTIEIDLGL